MGRKSSQIMNRHWEVKEQGKSPTDHSLELVNTQER